jgi:CRISPR/Cas system-associated exonuclease Cas4 (RecB family)
LNIEDKPIKDGQGSSMTIKKQGVPKRISVSQINKFNACPRQFQFSYIKHLKEITRSSQLNVGTEAHDLIARGIYTHPTDNSIDGMLKVAEEFLAQYDPKEKKIMEHKMTGTICGKDAVGIFDVIYPNLAKGIDWKASTNSPYKKISQDLQSYFYAILYEQNFKKEIDEIIFVFLKDGSTYCPKIQSDNFRLKCEKRIQNIIDEAYNPECTDYPKKPSPLCAWCGYSSVCEIFK